VIIRRPTTITFRVLAATVALALVVAAALTVILYAVGSLRGAVSRQARSKDTVAAALTLRLATADAESALRGYLLTANKQFERRWQQSARQIEPPRRRLDRLAEPDRVLAARVRALDRSIADYLGYYAEPLVQITKIAPEVARGSVAASERKRYVDAMHEQFARLLAAERARSNERAAAVRRASKRATIAAIGAIALCAALIVALGAFTARTLGRRLRDAASAATEIAGGEFSARLPEAGPAELVELGTAFNLMAMALDHSRAALLDQNRQLEESEHRKTELIAIVSHELRTPLAGLLGFTSLLLDRDFDEETRRRYLTIIHDESRRLSGLVDRFLDVERVEADAFEVDLKPIDVAALLRQQTEMMLSESPRHRLVLHLPPAPLRVLGDHDRLAQVTGNLIGNAVKYSPNGGPVEVAARELNGAVRIEVSDWGLGIPPEEQEQVFTKFYRGRAAAQGIPGTGLGLALARQIVEAHGGRIGFESEAGKGSTFWIELHAATADESPAESSATAA
jgi:signal transduction histidine kinase